MTITLDWWLVPTIITVAVIGLCLIPACPSRSYLNTRTHTLTVVWFQLFYGILASLAAWLLWAVF